MRRTEFRVFDKRILKMHYSMKFLNQFFDFVEKHSMADDVMQFTGLKDMNGKEIYEGDIVKSDWIIGVVKYNSENASFMPEDLGDEINPPSFIYNDWNDWEGDSEWEVIGNIYENPELLEANKDVE